MKRTAIAVSGFVFVIALFLIYSNILTLDDFHPITLETTIEDIYDTKGSHEEQQPESQNQSDTNNNIPSKGYHLHINLDQYMMYVYKDGSLLKTYPVSGGKRATPSPSGNWRIISKDTWGEGFGGAWLGINVPWGKYGIHGTVYPGIIGNANSSKGCIRMKNKDVRELYKYIPYGTTVSIVHTNRSFRTLKSGDIGSDVVEVQKALKKLGYYHGSTDGRFGSSLKNSVIKFQKTNKIKPSGVVGKQTFDAVMAQIQL